MISVLSIASAVNTSYVEGAHYYIIKPTSLQSLLVVLNRLFSCLGKDGGRPEKNNFVIRERSLTHPDHELEDSDYKG